MQSGWGLVLLVMHDWYFAAQFVYGRGEASQASGVSGASCVSALVAVQHATDAAVFWVCAGCWVHVHTIRRLCVRSGISCVVSGCVAHVWWPIKLAHEPEVL